jgi:hypothetical protein
MQDLSRSNIGIVMAYLLPGFATMWGASYFSETMETWLGATPAESPSVGGVLYVTVGSLGAGLIVSAVL